jgi:hypothetical protein
MGKTESTVVIYARHTYVKGTGQHTNEQLLAEQARLHVGGATQPTFIACFSIPLVINAKTFTHILIISGHKRANISVSIHFSAYSVRKHPVSELASVHDSIVGSRTVPMKIPCLPFSSAAIVLASQLTRAFKPMIDDRAIICVVVGATLKLGLGNRISNAAA